MSEYNAKLFEDEHREITFDLTQNPRVFEFLQIPGAGILIGWDTRIV